MAKKKTRDTEPKPKEFRSTPFNALKGVTVVVPDQKPAAAEKSKPPAPATDDDALFLQAMQGVQKVGERPAPGRDAASVRKTVPPTSRVSLKAELEKAEMEAFNRAIGRLKLDVTFSDRVPEDDELKPLGANRLRQLKRGVIAVDRQLDLHGLTREEALEALPRFLASAAAHGEKAVLVITGKGNNSPGEPVLQQAVAGWLRDAGKKLVVEYAPAPREMGGSGALVVFLRGYAD